jgi:hypothetical protein
MIYDRKAVLGHCDSCNAFEKAWIQNEFPELLIQEGWRSVWHESGEYRDRYWKRHRETAYPCLELRLYGLDDPVNLCVACLKQFAGEAESQVSAVSGGNQ